MTADSRATSTFFAGASVASLALGTVMLFNWWLATPPVRTSDSWTVLPDLPIYELVFGLGLGMVTIGALGSLLFGWALHTDGGEAHAGP